MQPTAVHRDVRALQSGHGPARRDRAVPRPSGAAKLGGALLVGAGVVILMGIITAEALFPVAYSTSRIRSVTSARRGTRRRIVREPSATIFNTTMLVTGDDDRGRRPWRSTGATGAPGAVDRARAAWGHRPAGVGIFPGTELHGEPVTTGVHPLVSMLTFISGALAALLAARITSDAISRHLRRARARRPGDPRALRRARLDGPRRWRCRALGRLSRRAVAGRIRRLPHGRWPAGSARPTASCLRRLREDALRADLPPALDGERDRRLRRLPPGGQGEVTCASR